MIIGDSKQVVIENIKRKIAEKDFNAKVEVGDPVFSLEETEIVIHNFLKERNGLSYKFKNMIARNIVSIYSNKENKNTEVIGIENIGDISGGAIITSNHFNQLDNLAVRKVVEKISKKPLYIISQDTNLAMPGIVGFMLKYADIIPISSSVNYMKNEFQHIIKKTLDNGNFILIYPEQEMWFNYKKPRPLKPGAYYYSAKLGVPIISCFVQMVNEQEIDNDEFFKVKHIIYVLKTIYPDPNKSPKENSKIMMNIDYEQKKEAYEKAYNKKLDYEFDINDIAGWRNIDE